MSKERPQVVQRIRREKTARWKSPIQSKKKRDGQHLLDLRGGSSTWGSPPNGKGADKQVLQKWVKHAKKQPLAETQDKLEGKKKQPGPVGGPPPDKGQRGGKETEQDVTNEASR